MPDTTTRARAGSGRVGLVVSNQLGEPRLELVYSSINWHYGLAWFRGSGSQPLWLGLGGYPAEAPKLWLFLLRRPRLRQCDLGRFTT